MNDRLTTYELMQRWDCTRQAVSQIMKRYKVEKMQRTGYKCMAMYRIEDVRMIESERQDECRP